MLRPDRLQGLVANHQASQCEYRADAKRRKGLEATMAVRMVLVSRSRCHSDANKDDARREDVARKLESSCNDGRGAREQSDDDVSAGQNATYANADEDDTTSRSIRLVDYAHLSIVDPPGICPGLFEFAVQIPPAPIKYRLDLL
jgi:hypothetical protein